MAPPTQSYGGGADGTKENPPSNNLWIGNVSADVNESQLKALFEKYGQIDSVTTYSSRNYAFVQFKEVEDARSAKQNLQGLLLHGNSLKIEFAKPAKPCKSLWVAGISQSVSKEELENEFLKFGKVQEFRFIRDRNTAFVDYIGLEDATRALKSMNGKRIGGAQIRVDYLRSQSSKRELGEGQFPGRNMGSSDFRWMGHDSLSNFPEPGLSGSKRKNYGDAPLSKVLWIRYPPSIIIEEDMLHNALILFGEIERIKTFSDKNYAFVEFRSVEEARRAKEGLQGKLFNDPRILIEYFNSDFPGGRGQVREYSIHPVQMDFLGLNHPVLLGNNPGHPQSLGLLGPDMYLRPPLGLHSAIDAAGFGHEPIDLAAVQKFQEPSPGTLMGGPSWNRLSPSPGIVSSPSAGFNGSNRSASGAWDIFDVNQLQRESKRSRFEAGLPLEGTDLNQQYGRQLVRSAGASASLKRGVTVGFGQRQAERDCVWRGLIAKGGTPVCRARCVPIGEGLASDMPDVVNCSARTGLDLLSQHYEDASGFDIVFFLPDSEEDFASYTEFLRYLGSKDRAGVAKFDDGTTLFLVPPSDFLTNVLKVSGPERLYGVVLKFPEVAPSTPTRQAVRPHYEDLQKLTASQTGYIATQPDRRILPLNNPRVLPDVPKMPAKPPVPMTSSVPVQSVAPTTVATTAGIALTPELIATLTSLLPSNNSSSGLQTAPILQNPSALGSTSHVSAPDNVANWKREYGAPNHNGHQLQQQLGSQVNPQLQHLQAAQAAPIVSNGTSQFHQITNSNNQFHEPTFNLAAQGTSSSKAMTPVIPLQSGQVSASPDMSQHYQQQNSQSVLRSQGMDNGPDALRLYNPSFIQHQAYPVASSNQFHANGAPQQQPYMPFPSEVEHTYQSQPPQTAAPFGTTQESGETEADKNERYKTTLLFAANLLSRIHQPSDNQPGQGAGSR